MAGEPKDVDGRARLLDVGVKKRKGGGKLAGQLQLGLAVRGLGFSLFNWPKSVFH